MHQYISMQSKTPKHKRANGLLEVKWDRHKLVVLVPVLLILSLGMLQYRLGFHMCLYTDKNIDNGMDYHTKETDAMVFKLIACQG